RRSFVSTKGHDYLRGADMSARRLEVFNRDQARCQYCGGIWGWETGEAHHVRPRGKGGSDDLDNLVWSCRACHRDQHVAPRWTLKQAKQELGRGTAAEKEQ